MFYSLVWLGFDYFFTDDEFAIGEVASGPAIGSHDVRPTLGLCACGLGRFRRRSLPKNGNARAEITLSGRRYFPSRLVAN